MAVTLSYADYIRRNNRLMKVPPRLGYNLISVDIRKYREAERERGRNIGIDWPSLRERTDAVTYQSIRTVFRRVMYYSQCYLPGYKFFWKDLLHKEWLSTVDWLNYHRDHLIHQNLTAYCGNVLLKGGQNLNDTIRFRNDRSLLDWTIEVICTHPDSNYFREYALSLGISLAKFDYANYRNRLFWKNIILNTLYAASLYHDAGYPWQYISKHSKNLRESDPLSNMSKADVKTLLEKYGNRLLFYPFRQYNSKINNISSKWKDQFEDIINEGLSELHGLRSAIAFLHINEKFRKYPDFKPNPYKTLIIDWAALIILMHDLPSLYGRVKKREATGDYYYTLKNPQLRLKFTQDPLSCVLCLTDQIQDFQRFNAKFSPLIRNRSVSLEYEIKGDSTYVDFDQHTGELLIRYIYPNPINRFEKRRFLRKENYKFFDPVNGYIDMSHVGVNSVNLQVGP